MRCSERERSDAILGRPTVMKPLQRLARKLTPVRTMIMTTIRPSFRAPPSRSRGARNELTDDCDFATSVAFEAGGTVVDIGIWFRAGEGKSSFLLAGTNSMADNSSDMIVQITFSENRSLLLDTEKWKVSEPFTSTSKRRCCKGVTQHASEMSKCFTWLRS